MKVQAAASLNNLYLIQPINVWLETNLAFNQPMSERGDLLLTHSYQTLIVQKPGVETRAL